jgi:hypothetical protein
MGILCRRILGEKERVHSLMCARRDRDKSHLARGLGEKEGALLQRRRTPSSFLKGNFEKNV